MADIGATLREARMRARIDISEIETATKIRAKYLRALENEEWDLLPGPTYVKSFLRTYAEALGLDARMLVEEYKVRHEGPPEQEPLRPRAAAGAGYGAGRGPRGKRPVGAGGGGRIPPGAIAAGLLLALLVGLFALGKLSGHDSNPSSAASVATTRSARSTPTRPARTRPKKRRKKKSKYVRLALTATAPVYVCLKAAGGRVLIKDETLTAGTTRGPFKSTDFRIGLGNNMARLRVNGKTLRLPASAQPLGFRITRRGRTTLPPGKRPVCTP